MAAPGTPDLQDAALPESALVFVLAAAAKAVLDALPEGSPHAPTAPRVLRQLLEALNLRRGLGNNACPPRGSLPPMPEALTVLETATYRTVRWLEAAEAASASASPSVLPADLENAAPLAGADLQAAPPSDQDVINLDTAAALLGLRSRQGASDLVRKHGLASWRSPGGRHELLVYRAEVIALREQRSGDGGTGSGEERAGDPGGAPGGGGARAGRSA